MKWLDRREFDKVLRRQNFIFIIMTLLINKKNKTPLNGNPVNILRYLVPAWWSVLLEAFLTIDWSTLGWFEWNLGFLSTVAADDFGHLSWTSVVTAPLSITHNFHSYFMS